MSDTTHHDPDDPAPPRFGNGMAPGTAIKWVYLPRWHLDVKSDRGLIVADGGRTLAELKQAGVVEGGRKQCSLCREETGDCRPAPITIMTWVPALCNSCYLWVRQRGLFDDDRDKQLFYPDGIETDGGRTTLIDSQRAIVRQLKQEGRAGLATLCTDGGKPCYSETLAAVGVLESEGVIEQVDGLRPRWRLVVVVMSERATAVYCTDCQRYISESSPHHPNCDQREGEQ